jgi:hypothetical protein
VNVGIVELRERERRAVYFQAELSLEGVVDVLDDLPQRAFK